MDSHHGARSAVAAILTQSGRTDWKQSRSRPAGRVKRVSKTPYANDEVATPAGRTWADTRRVLIKTRARMRWGLGGSLGGERPGAAFVLPIHRVPHYLDFITRAYSFGN